MASQSLTSQFKTIFCCRPSRQTFKVTYAVSSDTVCMVLGYFKKKKSELYKCKSSLVPDKTPDLEMAAFKRLGHLPTVADITDIVCVKSVRWVVSKALFGEMLPSYRGSKEVILSLFRHLFFTLKEMHERGVCHNNISGSRIGVIPTTLKSVRYTVGGAYVTVPCMGVMPVLLDFSMCSIENFWVSPALKAAIRPGREQYDFYRLFELMASFSTVFGADLRNNLAVFQQDVKEFEWRRTMVWGSYLDMICKEFPHLKTQVEPLSGLLLSFPKCNLPVSTQDLFATLDDCAREKKLVHAALDALDAGPTHSLHAAFSVLGTMMAHRLTILCLDDLLEEAETVCEKYLNGV